MLLNAALTVFALVPPWFLRARLSLPWILRCLPPTSIPLQLSLPFLFAQAILRLSVVYRPPLLPLSPLFAASNPLLLSRFQFPLVAGPV